MSSKLTEITESSPYAPPASVLCGPRSSVSWLCLVQWLLHATLILPKHMMAIKQLKFLILLVPSVWPKEKILFTIRIQGLQSATFFFFGKKTCHCSGPSASNIRRFLWSKKDGPFGKELPVSEAPTPDGTSRYSNLTCYRQRDVARWTHVRGPIPVGEVEVVHNSIGHQSSTFSSHPPAKRFQSHIILSTPRYFQQTLSDLPTSLPPASPSSSIARPALIPEVRPSPIFTSQQLQAVASSSKRREHLSPSPFPATQVCQQREHWPIQVTREDPNMATDHQDSVARLFRRVNRNSRELLEYANNRTIPETASEERAANLSWYEDVLINDFQKTFYNFGRDN
ncbi:hypothetical protein O181_028686 [Austropuccinia psidii MF-1]|uniref:Uncharacterized protein n=1 Tax=Austropuccinia psidii MF-1 TaxID=1389203 RepID=A0A9Q3CPN0_9BASI|nr:hypothetical protein [Austropuccinia psidii MF-1]